jgi:hypothetical protein
MIIYPIYRRRRALVVFYLYRRRIHCHFRKANDELSFELDEHTQLGIDAM